MDQSHRVAVQFLLADMAAALTFLDIADTTRLQDTRDRNLQNARLAYRTVLRLLPNVDATDEERITLEANTEKLKSRLIAAGYLDG